MPAVMTTILNTQYNGQGFDSAQAGFKGLQQSMNDTQKASETTGASMDGLFRRIERPVLAMAAISIADQLTGMGDKGQSASMMIERGLHAVGAALMFVKPELGETVIGAGLSSGRLNATPDGAVGRARAIQRRHRHGRMVGS